MGIPHPQRPWRPSLVTFSLGGGQDDCAEPGPQGEGLRPLREGAPRVPSDCNNSAQSQRQLVRWGQWNTSCGPSGHRSQPAGLSPVLAGCLREGTTWRLRAEPGTWRLSPESTAFGWPSSFAHTWGPWSGWDTPNPRLCLLFSQQLSTTHQPSARG